MDVRQYAGILGIVILLLGVIGLIMGDPEPIAGLLNIDLAEDIIHLVSGALLAYVGFAQRDTGLARMVVGVLGVIYLLVGLIGFINPTAFGLLQHGYTIGDNLIHLLIGALSIIVAYVLPRNTVTTT